MKKATRKDPWRRLERSVLKTDRRIRKAMTLLDRVPIEPGAGAAGGSTVDGAVARLGRSCDGLTTRLLRLRDAASAPPDGSVPPTPPTTPPPPGSALRRPRGPQRPTVARRQTIADEILEATRAAAGPFRSSPTSVS